MIAPNSNSNSNSASPNKPDLLANIVAQVLSEGATEFEVEYKDGEEQVCVMRGPIGFGILSLQSSSDEAKELRAQLYDLKKRRRKIEIDRVDYVLRVEVFDSFGEDAFRVSIAPGNR
jgi:hypothetical protein